jgi:Tetracyclin repressor-like, C-terminal domain
VPIVRIAGFDRPEERAALVAANLVGTGLARYVLAIEPLASMEPDVVRDGDAYTGAADPFDPPRLDATRVRT